MCPSTTRARVWLRSPLLVPLVVGLVLALAAPALAQDTRTNPPTGFGGGNGDGVTAPDTGTQPDVSQPPPPPPGPAPQPTPAAPGTPGAGQEVWSPLSFYGAARFQLGFEFFSDQPGLDAPTVFAQAFGVDAGLSINFTPWARLTLVPLGIDLVNSEFYYTHPDTGADEHTAIFGSRVTMGFLLDVGPVHFGFRFGDRDYWTNRKVGTANISVIGNDYNREVIDISVGYLADIIVGYVHLGATFEFPLDSDASEFAIFLDFGLRLYLP